MVRCSNPESLKSNPFSVPSHFPTPKNLHIHKLFQRSAKDE